MLLRCWSTLQKRLWCGRRGLIASTTIARRQNEAALLSSNADDARESRVDIFNGVLTLRAVIASARRASHSMNEPLA